MKILSITQKGLSIDVEIEGFAEVFTCNLPLINSKKHFIWVLKNAIRTKTEDIKVVTDTNEKYNTWVKQMVGEEIV